MNTRNRQI